MAAEPIIELELYLVRHGQSHGNAGTSDSSARGKEDPELTETGKNQVRLLGKRFASLPLDAVISSGLIRAMSTAAAVVSRQPNGGAKQFEINPIFTEVGCSTNEYSGIDNAELAERFPAAHFGGGEMLFHSAGLGDGEACERALKAARYLRNRFKSGEKVLIAAHGAFNTFLFFALLGIDMGAAAFDTNFVNTGVTKIVFYKEGTGPFGDDIHLFYCNDLSHLYAEYPDIGFINGGVQ